MATNQANFGHFDDSQKTEIALLDIIQNQNHNPA
jgi:hypothetical protein